MILPVLRHDPALNSSRGFRGWLRRHGYIVPSIVGVTLVFAWFATWGTWRLFVSEDEHWSFADRFFNAQAVSLRHGHLDVPPDSIAFEAFVHEGKTYGYFGIATSLLRVPLLWIFPDTETRWNRIIAIAACLLNLICAYLILLTTRQFFLPERKLGTAEKCWYSLFIWIAGLGSTNIYLGSRTFMYHEPIIWGAAFALLFYYFFLRYLIRPRISTLLVPLLCFCAAFSTRAPQGAGILFCLGLFAAITLLTASRSTSSPAGFLDRLDLFGTPKGRVAYAHTGLVVVGIILAVGSYSLVNYAKFGTYSGMPLNLYQRYKVFDDMATYQRIEGKPFHLSNTRMLIYNYSAPTKIRFTEHFPWVYLAEADDAEQQRFPEAKLDFASEFSSFPASKPALVFLSLFGVYSALVVGRTKPRVKIRLPLLGAAVGGSFIFVFINIAERYAHDFFPFLILAGGAGLNRILSVRVLAVRMATYAILLPLAAYSVCANTSFALVHQRKISEAYGNPVFGEKADEFKRWRETIDTWVAGWKK